VDKTQNSSDGEFVRSVIPGQIAAVVGRIKKTEVDALVEAILEAETVFIAGAGRSLLMLSAFAMRLVHLGLRAFVVGETSTPAISQAIYLKRLTVLSSDDILKPALWRWR